MPKNNDGDWSEWRRLILTELERLDEGIKAFDPKLTEASKQIQNNIDSKFEKLELKLEQDIGRRLRELEIAMATLKTKASIMSAGVALVVSFGLSLLKILSG
jgi:ethanolamine ammonia-lyase small subunit|tara:strand:+ start:3802 stop:4107 length:306 start_codon:yes stop_codon:yes gene_type:complete